MEWLNVMLDNREMLAYKIRDYKECQCEKVMSMKELFRVMTRSMAKTAKAEVPAMYRVMRPIAHKMPDMANLQIPPVLNEPIPMKLVKKATPVIDYDQILAPVNMDVTLKGQLPQFDMEKGFEAIHTTAEQLPDLESLFKEDKPLFKPGTEISLFMEHIPKQQELDKFVDYLRKRVIHDCKYH